MYDMFHEKFMCLPTRRVLPYLTTK